MAMPTVSPAPAPSAQVVGNVFVEQYYHILHQSPDSVYRFYQDSSVLSRPGPDGVMTSVTTMQAIDDKIRSLDYKDYKAEIKTVDAQESYEDGFVVLVTGCLTGKDNVTRKFTQLFFLAPQDKGYFVLNDVFRYVDEKEALETNPMPANGIGEYIATAPMTPDPETFHDPDCSVSDSAISVVEEKLNNSVEVYEPLENEEGSVVEEDIVVVEPPVHSIQNEVHSVIEPASMVQEDAPKKSYASIVKVMKGNVVPSPVNVATNTVQVAPATTEDHSLGIAAPEASSPRSNNAPDSSNIHEEDEGHSIYIRSLPLNVTVAQVEEEFKRFGHIKPGGVQVRSNKGFCFGFVEFESLSSKQSAIQASSVTIMGRQVFIEEKRTTTRVGSSGRGRFPPGRGAFRNDNFRGRGNFGGGRGYGRNEFSGRRGPSGRSGGESYQRVDQNGSGRVGRQGVTNQTTVSA